MRKPVGRAAMPAAAVLWLAATAGGFSLLLAYDAAPGRSGASPSRWPADTGLRRTPGRSTLVLAVHPQCPCTRATIEVLDQLMARLGERAEAQVLFYLPSRYPSSWARTTSWTRASAIPGVSVREDLDGRVAALLGARTSGHALLFAPDGRLLFSGGLTARRGHPVWGPGARTVASLGAGAGSAPTYGCALGAAPARAETAP